MKISGIALLAGLGPIAFMLPASAAPSTMGDGIGSAPPAHVQLAQVNTTRQANEERASDYRTTTKKKAKAKKRTKRSKKRM